MVQALMRKNQRVIWTVIAVVVVITFVFWGVSTGPSSSQGSGVVGTLYGRKVTAQQYLDAQRAVKVYFLLFMRQDLERNDQGRMMLEQQTWIRLIERKKINEWGLVVTDEQLIKFIQGMFTENGRFDPNKYREFTERQLPSYGINAADFERMLREQLCLDQVRKIAGSTTKVLPSELRDVYNVVNEKLEVSFVTFDAADFTNVVKVTDAEIKEYFEKNKLELRIPERRRVRYVRFGNEAHTNEVKVTDAEVRAFYDKNQAPFEEKGKVKPFDAVASEIRQQLINAKAFDRASEVAGELALDILKAKETGQKQTEPPKVDLAALAQKYGAKPQETEFFTARAPVPGLKAGPYFNQAAFALTPQEPISDVVNGQDGAYVLQYLEEKPSELPTLEAVKEQVAQRIIAERAFTMARTKAKEASRQIKTAIQTALAANPNADVAKLFADETQKLGLKPLNPPPFSQRNLEVDVPDVAVVFQTTFGMREREVSDFVETSRGGLFLLLKRRIPPSDDEYTKDRPEFLAQILNQKRQTVMNEWLSHQYRLANPPALTATRQQQEQAPLPPGQPSAPSPPAPPAPPASVPQS